MIQTSQSLKRLTTFSLSLFFSLVGLTGCSGVNESQAYKDGWNIAWETLNYAPMSTSEFEAFCESASQVYAADFGLSEEDAETQDFIAGCQDWGVSGEKGLNQK